MVLVGRLLVVGDVDVHGFDRLTGALRWSFHPPEDASFPGNYLISTDGQRIFAGSKSGHAYAIDAATGQAVWTATVATGVQTNVFDPVYDAGTVYVCTTRFTFPTTGGITALDAVTGGTKWSRDFPPTPPNDEAGCQSLAVTPSIAFGTTYNGHIVAVNRVTGAIDFTIPQLANLPPGTGGSPLLDDRPLAFNGASLFAGSTTGYITAFDPSAGTELWRVNTERGTVNYPLVADKTRLYVIHAGFQLAALDPSTGRIIWRRDDGIEGGEFLYTPAIDRDRIFVPGEHGFYALRR